MKNLIMLILFLPLFLIGCNSNNTETKEPIENTPTITLSDEDIKIINDDLASFTKYTAFENAVFKVDIDEKKTATLRISVIRDIDQVINYYGLSDVGETVKFIRKSLTFDTIYDSIKSKSDKEFEGMKVYFYDSEDFYDKNDFYTLKDISNK